MNAAAALLTLLAATLGSHPAVHESSAPDPTAKPGVEIIPISGRLGLVDVVFHAPGRAVRTVEARASFADGSRVASARLLPAPAADDDPGHAGPRWTARLMIGDGDTPTPPITVSVQWFLQDQSNHWIIRPDVSAEPEEAHRTPDWAKGAVWYQVFVERFRNGDPGNDPPPPHFSTRPWNEPWHSLTPDELEAGWSRAAGWAAAGAIESIARRSAAGSARQARRYGGDLPGVLEALSWLRELGIDALYLCPIFEARTAHKYDASDFRRIDPTFTPASHTGRDGNEWFQLEFLPSVHAAGLRIILDGVWNHVGIGHWAFQDVVRRGRSSPYADWFDGWFASGDPAHDGGEFDPGALIGWRGWNRRNGDLPVFARTADDLVPPVREHVFEVTRQWMNPDAPRDQRIDGWRLDVAPDLPLPFWSAWRRHVKSIDPDALLIGEVWFPARSYFGGAAFDGQMNYPFAMPAVRFLAGDPAMTSADFAVALQRVFSNHPATDLVQLNLFGSHDTARIATMLHDPRSAYEPAPWFTRPVDRNARPDAAAYRRVILGVALQATLPGAPMIYYGDEVGAFGPTDPHCRKPYPWSDQGPWPTDSHPDFALREQFKAMLTLRREAAIGPVLRYGGLRLEDSRHPDVLAFRRFLNHREVLVVVNRGTSRFDAHGLACWDASGVGQDDWQPMFPVEHRHLVPPLEARIWHRTVNVKMGNK